MPRISLRRSGRALKWLLSGTPAQRRRVRQELARISAGLFGDFPLSDDFKLWREDKLFLADYARLSPNNPYSQDRKWTLRELTLHSNELDGDLAECGCFEGASAYFIAKASSHGVLHLFDSFEGLSGPAESDRASRDDVMGWAQGDLRATEEKLRANLQGLQAIEIHPGWIPTQFHKVADRRFRLVHLDVDLEQPTRDSLEFFYPRLVEGGVVVMDDYGLLTCPGAQSAADRFAASLGTRVLHLPTGQGLLFKGARPEPGRDPCQSGK